ncbi:MAG: hypothetical protein H0T10_05000, partial [Actinobacteria bacterium]|nr:hypothetical protein [Actinomycetota bacterium]
PEEALDAEAGETPAKKKTRRGSRGGRNRKKKPAGATAEADGDEHVAEDAESPVLGAPRIHVPDFELGDGADKKPQRRRAAAKPTPSADEGDDEAAEQVADAVTAVEDGAEPAPAKKKTRRGSRGGRNRKKPAAVAAGAAGIESENGADPVVEETVEEAVPAAAAASGNGADPATDDYVPMSEWLDDLDA